MQKLMLLCKGQPGMGPVLLDGFRDSLPDTRAHDGCESVDVYVDADNPDTVLLIEEWESRCHYKEYMAWRVETGVIELLESVLVGPLEVRFLERQSL